MPAAAGRQSIFITGAASGMGRETALLFQQQGWFVGAFDLNERGLVALQAELGADNCLIGQLDVSDKTAYEQAVQSFSEATDGRMDILFNNAGIAMRGFFDEMPFEEQMRQIQVNLVGVLNGIHLALPLLKATPNALCFTTSSSSATMGMPLIAVYSATKHAVKGLTEALSNEFRRFDIRVADVLPGLIRTAMPDDAMLAAAAPTGAFRIIEAVEVAKVVWQAYQSDTLHWYVPQELADLDKAAGNDPEKLRDKLARQI
ncbi:SDR family oxidoreductase [Halopseudomonas salegens]|uniref:NADP-dependent 3-hydroxy acid dehydrogenase YdfG n=1 Tax=Halopseudomonas salegens TaxID=1434072 RepID=A0A1H2HLL6_9GAMM|nr:SDR family oxidoreductase [Halopseudomonas salegens]SDU32724.1 NADP-dependent 3-hydroxy acid dehydrogenase YdfG [Halopseudomonas salegens]